MTLLEKFGYMYVRYLVNPRFTTPPVNFKKVVSTATSVLVLPPANAAEDDADFFLQQICSVFTRHRVKQFIPGPEIILPGIKKQYTTNIFTILKSPAIKKYQESGHVNVLIDLECGYNLPALYLAKYLRPDICISFEKPGSKALFNLAFKPSPDARCETKVKELCAFIQSMGV